MAESFKQQFLSAAIETLTRQKRLAEGAMAQLREEDFNTPVAPGMNPISVIVKHLAGNMASRWTDFLTSDGEKSWRDRETEFTHDQLSRAETMARWEEGWACVMGALNSLAEADLSGVVTIRGESHTIARAVLRQIDHYGYHVGQIVSFSRMLVGEGRWRHLSIPPGQSAAFNASMRYDPDPSGA